MRLIIMLLSFTLVHVSCAMHEEIITIAAKNVLEERFRKAQLTEHYTKLNLARFAGQTIMPSTLLIQLEMSFDDYIMALAAQANAQNSKELSLKACQQQNIKTTLFSVLTQDSPEVMQSLIISSRLLKNRTE